MFGRRAVFSAILTPAIVVVLAWLPAHSQLPANTAQIQQFFNRLPALPSQSMQTTYANLIGGMKSAGITDLCPATYFYATFEAGASLLNLNSASYKATPVLTSGIPAFTVNSGWTGGGVNSYINTNYNPTAAADGLYTLNAALLWWYSPQTTSTSSQPWLIDTAASSTYFWNNADGSVDWTINNPNASKHLASTPKDGFFIMKRTAANATVLLRNDVQIDSSTIASVSIPTNGFGVPEGVGNSISAFGVCALLSISQQTTLNSLIHAAAQAVGLP